MRALCAALLALAFTAGCAPSAAAPSPKAKAARGPDEITILFTTDEHGWILPRTDKGKVRGGAAEMLGLWVAMEGHCPGPPSSGSPNLGSPSPACADPRTLALSGGDNYTGPAISTYFVGAPMAEALARMGYAASAFGNHELDFGRAAFLANQKTSKIQYLAANLRAPDSLPEMRLPPFAVFERRGIKIGVVGLATDTTLRAAMAKRFEGITFEKEEPALDRAVRGAWAAGVDLVIAIAHECPDKLAPIVERHPEWRLSFVGAGHCHKMMTKRPLGVPVIAPGWRLDHYARVRLRVDASRPAGERLLSVEPDVVSMSRREDARATAEPDPVIAARAETWRAKVDAALGEEIGFSDAGIERDTPEMDRWIAGALRAETGADVAVVNAHGIRQSLPRGPITKAHVWSILPFDNRVVTFRIDGASLRKNLRRRGAVADGIAEGAIEDGRTYTVTTLDFLYFGGDHFTWKKHAEGSVEGADWRELVIAWTRKQRSSTASPLEGILRRKGR
jgi:5'-nucleotidase / UDP-sugar diphosphatase